MRRRLQGQFLLSWPRAHPLRRNGASELIPLALLSITASIALRSSRPQHHHHGRSYCHWTARAASFHANQAIDNGLSRSEAAEVVTQVAFYAGWPRAMSAVPVLKKVFEARDAAAVPVASDIRVVRAGDGRTDAPALYFTGKVETSGLTVWLGGSVPCMR